MIKSSATITNRYPLTGLLGMLLSSSAWTVSATEKAPDVLLQDALQTILTALRTHRAEIKENPKYIFTIANELLVPLVDGHSVSSRALGKYWRKASKSQCVRFKEQFKELLINFYSLALAEYLNVHDIPDDVIQFVPINMSPPTSKTIVHTQVRKPDGKLLNINYMVHEVKGQWKIYDLTVNGVSVVTAYRYVFASEIDEKGVDGLITTLMEHNQKLCQQDA